MRRIASLLVLGTLAVVGGQASADCVRMRAPLEAFERATVVFSGEAVDRVGVDGESDYQGGYILFKVDLIWKGPISSTFTILPGPSVRFVLGKTYMVYAKTFDTSQDAVLVSPECSRRLLASDAVWDRAVLREPYVVDATKVLGRPSVAELEEIAEGRTRAAGQAQRALEDMRQRNAGGSRSN